MARSYPILIATLIVLLTLQSVWSYNTFAEILQNQRKIMGLYEQIITIDQQRVIQNKETKELLTTAAKAELARAESDAEVKKMLQQSLADDKEFLDQCLSLWEKHTGGTVPSKPAAPK